MVDFGSRTGSVFVDDFDVGLAETLGSELVTRTIDGEAVQEYALLCDGVTGPPEYDGLVPVFMGEPEPAYAEQLLPQIVIIRSSIEPDMARWHAQGFEYQVAALDAVDNDVPGSETKNPSKIEIKRYAFPFTIPYDVHLRTRHQVTSDRLLKKVGKVFWAYGQIRLRDSEGHERGYYAFMETISSLNEVLDVTDRLKGYTLSLRTEAELDFRDPAVARTVHTFRASVEALG